MGLADGRHLEFGQHPGKRAVGKGLLLGGKAGAPGQDAEAEHDAEEAPPRREGDGREEGTKSIDGGHHFEATGLSSEDGPSSAVRKVRAMTSM